MTSSLKAAGFSSVPDAFIKNRGGRSVSVFPSFGAPQLKDSNSRILWGKTLDSSSDQKGASSLSVRAPKPEPIYAQASVTLGKSLRWWEKFNQPNMIDISSAQELVDSLLDAGDRLVVIDFYSPGCGGCKALHPKICQIAELNANVLFLKVNYEEHKKMCHAFHVHVLPFFRFYRGAEGRVCSFSCTNATIKKFKDALAKHGAERCSPGPAKGLAESELLALASIGLISTQVEEEKVEGRGFGHSKADVHQLKESSGFALAVN